MEQYFKASGTISKETKVTLASMHLSDDTKLWWRSKVNDIQNGQCAIDTWKDLKKELRTYFFPENVEFIARRKLLKLR
ncbi:9-cis-epoxycarotenoid dioxygenase NCED6 [Cucumis melo var. makuwa]|uniref:9-cis-epoxycarotenoid dioxygenase NCED6 n=1 Tax=Cucumis melo var. makuwa TaxID=1194695 RepID=A0A5A7TH80_CUCMM|nr:9-cis-epoxycarotenoid dioxygenase NCED6 [Cucumis melo var. makuwa]TYK05666.1 9-cis-epoxycarotenoid dioxygenase NCED6 [Cucumis melo var. makuwa]